MSSLADPSQVIATVAPTRNLSRPILRICGLVALCLSALGLVGWFADIAALKTVLPNLPPMKPNCAIGLAAGGAAVMLASRWNRPRLTLLAIVLALLVGLIGATTILQYVWGIDLGIDDLLAINRSSTGIGRLSLVTGLEMVLLAIAVPCVTFPRPWTRLIVWACSVLGLLIGFVGMFFTLVGIFYDPDSLYGASRFTTIALHAGIGFFILFCGLLVWGCRDSLRLPLVSLAVLVLAPLAAVMVYFALAERRAALDAGRERIASRARLLSIDTSEVIGQAHSLLRLIGETRSAFRARTGMSDDTTPGPDCEKYLDGLLRLYTWVAQLRISTVDGTAICSTSSSQAGTVIADRNYFAEAIQERKFSISGLLISRTTRQPRLFAALPLLRNDAVIAVVSLTIDLSLFDDIIGRVGLEPGESAEIISRNGIVFANRPQPPNLVGARLTESPIVKLALREGEGSTTDQDWYGRDRLFAFKPIADTGAIVLVGLDKRAVTEAIDRTLRDRVLLLALIMAATAVAGLLGGEILIFRPIRRLAQRAALIEHGDFGGRARAAGVGEIWTLQNAFIRMRDSIADRERRLSEALARHRAVFESAIDAIITINDGGTIESLNPAAERLFGYKREALLNRHITVLLPNDTAVETPHAVHDLGALPGLGQVREIAARRADGSSFPADVALSEMRLGERRLLVAVVRDASERKRIDQMKSEFVSTVSHELRTPLTSIAGSLGLLAGGAAGQLPDPVQRLIAIAHRNSQRLIRLINDILDLEKIEAGNLVFARAPVDVRELAAEVIEANQPFGQTQGVRLKLDADSPDATVTGDRDRLMQVLTNLLSNAIKFSPGGGAVRVRVSRNQNMVRLTVADQGPGIPAEFRARIFTRFAQADSSDARNKGGTGLGLAVAKEIVERHGGEISFESEVGRGTAFYVDLPAAEPVLASDATDAAAEILVVEDDHDTAAVMRDMLARSGFTVAIATTAKDAEVLAANKGLRMILVDLGLPDRDGISLIRSLRSRESTRRIPIVVATARKRSEAEAAEAVALEVLDWIEKPVDLARLRETLDAAIGPAETVRILHVEDDPDVRDLVAQALAQTGAIHIHSVGTLAAAEAAIARFDFDIVILDMGLPDGPGSILLPRLKNRAGDAIPVIVFSARDTDPDVARQVQTVLTKSQNSLEYLVRIVARLCRPAPAKAESA